MAGSLIKKDNNKWELRVSLGYGPDGKQRRKTKNIYAKSKKEAERQLAAFYLEMTGKLVIDKEITFSEFVEYWKKRHGKQLSLITQERYQQMLADRILPAFGQEKLNKITSDDILRFMLQLENSNVRLDNRPAEKLASVTVRKHFKLLHLIFNKAFQWKYLTKNPCQEVPKDMLAKPESNHYPIWNREDLSRFLSILDKEPDTLPALKNKLLFYIALGTGARRGEFLGITWDCVDFENNSIKIVKSLKFVHGYKPFFGEPKTKSSVRVLFFDDFTKNLFFEYRKKIDAWYRENHIVNKHNLVFVASKPNDNNEAVPVDGSSFYLWLKRMCIKHSLPRIAVHSIRAMAATYALMSGMPLNMVQTMLGHTNIATTSIYLHDVADQRKDECRKYADSISKMRKA